MAASESAIEKDFYIYMLQVYVTGQNKINFLFPLLL